MPEASTAAPNNGSANPAGGDWRAAFGAEAAEPLKSFENPGAFLKSWQDSTAELTKLKAGSPPAYDWRKEITGGDEKALKTFERFSTIQDAGKAYLEAVNKIRSGDLAKPLAKDAKPEEVAEWRKANGIPEKPEGYFEKLPNGRVIGKDDLPIFNDVAAKLHAHNVPPAAMHELVDWYYKLSDTESAKISEADKADARNVEDTLRKEWGNDYRANENGIENYLAGLPEGVQKALRDGFGGDGKKFAHNPELRMWLSNIAREFNSGGMVAVGGNEGRMQSITDEIEKLQKLSAEKPKDYWGTRNETRHRELIAARDKLKGRISSAAA